MSSGYIKKIQTLGLINNIDYSGLSKCQICATSKLTKKTCSSVTRETKLLELIHYDLGDLKQTMCDAPKPGGPLTTRQPVEYKWRSGYPTPLQKIGQSLLCTGSSTQKRYLHIPVPNSPIIAI